MSITVTDVTAGELVLTIDNTGQMYFGDGTPIDMLTLQGYGIIDYEGQIIHGIGSPNIKFSSGVGELGFVGSDLDYPTSATISTLVGVMPTVQLDSGYPSQQTGITEGHQITNEAPFPKITINGLAAGSFSIICTEISFNSDGGAPAQMPIPTYAFRWL